MNALTFEAPTQQDEMDEILYFMDDSKEFTDSIVEILEHKNYVKAYKVFNDVTEFLKYITPRIGCVILDFYMPKMNGLEVMKRIREVAPRCLIIFVSINQYTQLPLPTLRDKYITFVAKDEDHYVNTIVDLAEKHFDLLKKETEFFNRLQRQSLPR